MKSDRRGSEFTRSDFESFLFWRVFWKMVRADHPLVFLLKVCGCGAFLGSNDFLTFPYTRFISGAQINKKGGGWSRRP